MCYFIIKIKLMLILFNDNKIYVVIEVDFKKKMFLWLKLLLF